MSVTSEEIASERLLNASALIAIEEVNIPAKNFPAARSKLPNIPTKPLSMPNLFLTGSVFGSSFLIPYFFII